MKNLKNLMYFYTKGYPTFYSMLLYDLKQLKEVHLNYHDDFSKLFELKERYGRTDLKIYFCGLLLNGPENLPIDLFPDPNEEFLVHLSENPSRLADEMPLLLLFSL